MGFNGGILADKMGLGKTVQVIAAMVNTLPRMKGDDKFLIARPVALLDQCKFKAARYTYILILLWKKQVHNHIRDTLRNILQYSSECYKALSTVQTRAGYFRRRHSCKLQSTRSNHQT